MLIASSDRGPGIGSENQGTRAAFACVMYAMPESLETRLHAEPFDRKDGRKRKLDDHKHDNACASVCRLSFEADRYACGGQETRTEIISVTPVTGCHLHPHRGCLNRLLGSSRQTLLEIRSVSAMHAICDLSRL